MASAANNSSKGAGRGVGSAGGVVERPSGGADSEMPLRQPVSSRVFGSSDRVTKAGASSQQIRPLVSGLRPVTSYVQRGSLKLSGSTTPHATAAAGGIAPKSYRSSDQVVPVGNMGMPLAAGLDGIVRQMTGPAPPRIPNATSLTLAGAGITGGSSLFT